MSTNNTNANTTITSRMPVHTATRTIGANSAVIREERSAIACKAQRAIRSAFYVCLNTRKAQAWRYAMTDSATETLRTEVEEVWRPVLCDHVARQACHDILDNISMFVLSCALSSTAAEKHASWNHTEWSTRVTLVLVADGDVIAKLKVEQDWTA